MKFGIIYPNYGLFCSNDRLRDIANIADAHFTALLTWDHYIYSNGNYTLDAFSLLANLAAQTQSVRLGTCVTPLPLRGPVITAKLTSSLDLLSNGRAVLGVGAGWLKKEFDFFGTWKKPSDRVNAVEEGIRQLKSLLTGKKNENDVGEEEPIFPCVQKPHPPIWIGTRRKRMLRIASDMADGWIPTRMDPRDYSENAKYVKGRLQRAKEFTFGCHLSARFRKQNQAKYIESLIGAGCNFLAIYPQGGVEEYLKSGLQFAKEVIPSFT